MLDYLIYRLEQFPYLGNKYLFALMILVVFSIAAKVFQSLFALYLKRVAGKTKTVVDDLVFEKTKNPLFYFILASGLKVSLLYLGVNGIINKFVNSIMAIVFLFIFLRGFDVIISTWGITIAKKTMTDIDEVLLPLIHKILKIIFIFVGLMWILSIWSIDITPYLAGVGISGLILGMALQDSLKNVFGGISLLFDKNFKIGDPIRLESGELGTVMEIGLRSTKINTYDNEIIFIPNGQMANMKIRNYVQPNTRVRKIVEFSVEYGTNPEKVKQVVLPALKKIKDIYDDPYMDVIFTQMGDSGLHFSARFWVDWDNAYNKYIEATEVIYYTLNKAKIGIPFPTRTIYMKK